MAASQALGVVFLEAESVGCAGVGERCDHVYGARRSGGGTTDEMGSEAKTEVAVDTTLATNEMGGGRR